MPDDILFHTPVFGEEFAEQNYSTESHCSATPPLNGGDRRFSEGGEGACSRFAGRSLIWLRGRLLEKILSET